MTRTNVYRTEDDGTKTLDGWFDPSAADAYCEDTRWDGNNHVSVPTGSQWDHEMIYRTRGGRWVLHQWSQWQGSTPSYRFIADDQAEQWLIANRVDEAVATWFGQIDEERGPGRPEVGQPINIRLGDALLARVDRVAADRGITRVELIRRELAESLG